MEKLNKLIYYDPLNEESFLFLSDAKQSTVDNIPEVEWYAVKNVLINFGYTIIEIKEDENWKQ